MAGGLWDSLNLPSYPAVVNFSVAAVLYVPARAYLQNHKLAAHFEDVDGKELPARFEGEFRVGAAPHMRTDDPTIMPFVAQITNFVIERPSDYSCVLQVDRTELARWRFRAIQTLILAAGKSSSSGVGAAESPLPGGDEGG
jgi:hypothetical protein